MTFRAILSTAPNFLLTITLYNLSILASVFLMPAIYTYHWISKFVLLSRVVTGDDPGSKPLGQRFWFCMPNTNLRPFNGVKSGNIKSFNAERHFVFTKKVLTNWIDFKFATIKSVQYNAAERFQMQFSIQWIARLCSFLMISDRLAHCLWCLLGVVDMLGPFWLKFSAILFFYHVEMFPFPIFRMFIIDYFIHV